MTPDSRSRYALGPSSRDGKASPVERTTSVSSRESPAPPASNPLVSVIIPNFNQAAYVRAAIESVLSQTHRTLEIVICDDASTDGSVDELRSIISDHAGHRITLLENERNRGVSYSRNRAMQVAQGDFFAFLDADDLWLPEKIAAQIGLFHERPEVGLVFTGAEPFADQATREWLRQTPGLAVTDLAHWAHNDNAMFQEPRPIARSRYLELFLEASFLCWSSVMVRRSTAVAVGGFNERLAYQSEDWIFVLSCLLIAEVDGIQDRLTRYRLHAASYTCRVLIQDTHSQKEECRLRREVGRVLRRFYITRGLRHASPAQHLDLARFAVARLAHRLGEHGRSARGRLSGTAIAGLRVVLPQSMYRRIQRRVHPPPDLELLVLFVTSSCNLSCGFCFYADNLNTGRDLHLDKLLQLIGSTPRTAVIELGGGEPFANRSLDQVMLACLERADLVSLNTNGTLKTRVEETLRTVLGNRGALSGRLQISVSIDGTEAIHNDLRGQDCFQTILSTLRMLQDLRSELGGFSLHVNTVMTHRNADTVPTLMDFLLDEFDLDYHNVEIERSNPNSEEGIQLGSEELERAYLKVLNRLRTGYSESYEESRARFSIQFLNRTEGRAWPFACSAGRESLVVYEDGRYSSCEMLDVVGHVGDHQYDLRRILASSTMRSRVAEIAKGECFCTHGCWVISSQIGHGREVSLELEDINPGVLRDPADRVAAKPTISR